MKRIFTIAYVVAVVSANAAGGKVEGWRPTPAEASAIGDICLGWRHRGVGILLLRQQGAPKPVSQSELESKVIDEVYKIPDNLLLAQNVDLRGMAGSAGEQFCVEAVKEKFRIGQLHLAK